VTTFADILAQAKAYHHSGQLAAAAELYRQMLAADPAHVEARYLLGAACHAMGQLSDAAANLREALRLRPDLAEVHHQLGIVLAESQRPADAERCIRRALALKPQLIDAHHDLGVLLIEQSRAQEAANSFRRVVELKPHDSIAHCDLGAALERQGDLDAAADCFRLAIQIDPAHAEAHSNLGAVLEKQENLDEAETCCRRAIQLKPNLAEAHNNLGGVLRRLERFDEAVDSCRRAIQLKPGLAEAHYNLGAALHKSWALNEAAECLRQAIRIKPAHAEALNGLGVILAKQGRQSEAFASFRQALHLDPEHADAHFNYAFSLLLTGQLTEGWPELEWRFRRKGKQLPDFGQPAWAGEDLAGRTILLHAEQGLGDTLQFIRYAELIAEQGGQVILEVQRKLLPLLEQSGFRNVIAKGSPRPLFDVYAPLMSLPGLVGTTLDNIPNRVPYLSANPRLGEKWRVAMGGGGLKIGIAWQGNSEHDGDRFRSIPLKQFARLAGSDIELISLQKGAGREQLAALRGMFPVRELQGPIDELHGAFMDTAAIIQNLDLVVTCDTAIAHLAGALGGRVWLALSTAPDWRWLLDRPDSPWYPTMRLFRQTQLGRWDEVFDQMRDELQRLS
jgi:tetratricopeptide (TPR) repeat protein